MDLTCDIGVSWYKVPSVVVMKVFCNRSESTGICVIYCSTTVWPEPDGLFRYHTTLPNQSSVHHSIHWGVIIYYCIVCCAWIFIFSISGIATSVLYWPAKIADINKVVMFRLQLWDAGETTIKKFHHILPVSIIIIIIRPWFFNSVFIETFSKNIQVVGRFER